jgi:hypothetical protein
MKDDLKRRDHDLIEVLFRFLHRKTKKNINSVKAADISAKVLAEHLTHTSLDRYCFNGPLTTTTMMMIATLVIISVSISLCVLKHHNTKKYEVVQLQLHSCLISAAERSD